MLNKNLKTTKIQYYDTEKISPSVRDRNHQNLSRWNCNLQQEEVLIVQVRKESLDQSRWICMGGEIVMEANPR